ncbi:helix-turn-helix domain-containing protein [Salininema proteolyticum]|uniref:Helix-turn-helix domain-containing protein n=1 Tax=Salininema proteolyticum TaxID=1607685 RepID=A0ABV8TXV9_9ACTN
MNTQLIAACRDRVLKSREKIVLLILATFADGNGRSARLFVNNLAELSGLSRRTVQRALRGLEDRDLVRRHRTPGGPSSFTVSIDAPAPEYDPARGEPKPESATPAPIADTATSEEVANTEPEPDSAEVEGALLTVGNHWRIYNGGLKYIRDHVARLVAGGWDGESLCNAVGPRTDDIGSPFGVLKHRLHNLLSWRAPVKTGSLPQRRYRCWTCQTPTDNQNRYCDACIAHQSKPRTVKSWRDLRAAQDACDGEE